VHSNFVDFVNKIEKQKSIIYTFSNSLEKISNLEKINHPKLGKVEQKDILNIKLSSIKGEDDLETCIDNFYIDNYKICIIQFTPYEGSYMDYIKYFIENKERNKNISNKYIIFIVYMLRISKSDLKDLNSKTKNEQISINKKILKETMTSLSGYYQIFIDNLNGNSDIGIEKIIDMDKIELFQTFIDCSNEISSTIFETMSYIKYNINSPYEQFKNIEYYNLLMKFIEEQTWLKYLISDCLFEQIKKSKQDDLICTMFKNKDLLRGDEIDIFSVIKLNIIKIFKDELSIFFFKAEKNQFFSTLLTNYLMDKNNINEKSLISYFPFLSLELS
jgi:hypothetical protein